MKMNKFICLLMAILMLLTVSFPVAVFADDEELLEEDAYVEAVEEEIIPDEFIVEEDTYIDKDALSEQEEEILTESELVEEAQEAEEAQETITNDAELEAVGEDNEFDAAYVKILEQPKDASGAVGTNVTFHVTTVNVVTYQWQISTNNGESWSNAGTKYYGGTTTDTITVPVKAARDGFLFRCALTGISGKTVPSDAAKLTVANGPTITEQPKDTSGAAGTNVTFHVAAKNAATYQWQVSADNGSTWAEAKTKYYTGVTTDTITVPVKDNRDGYLFRCIVTDSNGETVPSDAAKLTVANGPTITEQPKDATGAAGTNVTFHVAAKNAATYQWQVSADNGAAWAEAKTKYYTGVTTDTITVPVKDNRDGYLFRCIVADSNGKTVPSDAAKLTVASGPSITEQPKDATGAAGTNVTFHVAAKNAATYQWQVSADNGATWAEAKVKYYTGVTTDTITVPVKDNRDGYLFRCVVTASNGISTTSDNAKLTVEKNITVNGVIYEKLTDSTCAVVGYTGTAASYTVEKTVNGMTVTEIGEEAFMGNTNLQSITLPDTITIIRARAFKGCTSLSTMG